MKIPRTRRHIRFVSSIFHFNIIWRQNTEADRRTRRRRRRVIAVRCDFRYRIRSAGLAFRPMRLRRREKITVIFPLD